MSGKLAFIVGAAVGYVLGTRAGREQYDKIKTQARSALEHPAVRDKVTKAETAISDAVKEQGHQVTDKVAEIVREKFSGSSGGAGGASSTGTTGTSNGPDSAWDSPKR